MDKELLKQIEFCSECGGRALPVYQDLFEPYYYQIECWDKGDKIVVGKTLEEAIQKWNAK